MKVLVTGAAGPIGRELCRQLAADGRYSVIGVDRRPLTQPLDDVDFRHFDLRSGDVGPIVSGADVVVHLANGFRADSDSAREESVTAATAQRLFAAAGRADVKQLVLVSTAMVYGAWADNPVPLTEEAPVRPIVDFTFAVHRAEIEKLGRTWRRSGTDRRLAVLRPAVTVGGGKRTTLTRLLRGRVSVQAEEGDAPAQFVHTVDLATAISVAVGHGYDGVLNVAPDGWIAPDALAELIGPKPRVWVPERVARRLAQLGWLSGVSTTPPGIVPYRIHPWVVSNDRLRELGWEPTHSNEEAYVASHDPGPLDKLDAKRKQQLSLAVAGIGIVAVIGAVIAAIVRFRRRVAP